MSPSLMVLNMLAFVNQNPTNKLLRVCSTHPLRVTFQRLSLGYDSRVSARAQQMPKSGAKEEG